MSPVQWDRRISNAVHLHAAEVEQQLLPAPAVHQFRMRFRQQHNAQPRIVQSRELCQFLIRDRPAIQGLAIEHQSSPLRVVQQRWIPVTRINHDDSVVRIGYLADCLAKRTDRLG